MPVAIQPFVDFAKRLCVDRVETPVAFDAHGGKTAFAQHSQMLRGSWLGDPELCLNHIAKFACGALPVSEEFEQAPAHRVAENLERMHGKTVCDSAYIIKCYKIEGPDMRRLILQVSAMSLDGYMTPTSPWLATGPTPTKSLPNR